MQRKTTKLNLTEEAPTTASSTLHGSNLNGVGFNISFINMRDPELVADIFALYERAKAAANAPVLNPNDPVFMVAREKINGLMLDRVARDSGDA